MRVAERVVLDREGEGVRGGVVEVLKVYARWSPDEERWVRD